MSSIPIYVIGGKHFHLVRMVRSPNELNIDNILTNHEIKKELIKIIKNQIGSENVELTVEPANKKGIHICV